MKLNASLEKYNNTDKGYLCLSNVVNNNWKQHFFKTDDLINANKHIENNKQYDSYNSIATFNSPLRQVANIRTINSHAIDIDNHLKPFTLDEAKMFVNEVLEPLYDIAMPIPSLIVYSGRGLQIHFNLRGANDVVKWKYTQQALIERLNNICYKNKQLVEVLGLEIDKQVNDCARVMRTPGTLNTKSNTLATTIYKSDNTYTQAELINNYDLTYTIEKGKNKGVKELLELEPLSPQKITNANARELKQWKSYNAYYTRETLNHFRIQDMLKLIEIRNNRGFNVGYRSNLMSILVQLEKERTQDNEQLLINLIDFNNYFNEPLRDSEVVAWYNCAISKPQMHFSNRYIINKLNISIQEQEQLITIVSRQVKNKRYYCKNREQLLNLANSKYLPIKTINTMNRNAVKRNAIELRKQGYKIKDIVSETGKSKSQVLRYLKNI